MVYSAWSEVRLLSFKHKRFVQRDEVGLDVYHRLLWGNRNLYCSIIHWFSHVGMGVNLKINLHMEECSLYVEAESALRFLFI